MWLRGVAHRDQCIQTAQPACSITRAGVLFFAMNTRIALLIPLAVALAGCESMSVSECRVADWTRVGMADGSAGVSEQRIASYTEDCGKAGVMPNAQAYRRGWDAGIVQFCTPANGWREGVQGNSGKASVCQGQAGFAGFSHYLDLGMQVHRMQELLQRNGQESSRLQARLEASKSDEEKKNLREDLRHIDREQFRLRSLLMRQQMLAP